MRLQRRTPSQTPLKCVGRGVWHCQRIFGLRSSVFGCRRPRHFHTRTGSPAGLRRPVGETPKRGDGDSKRSDWDVRALGWSDYCALLGVGPGADRRRSRRPRADGESLPTRASRALSPLLGRIRNAFFGAFSLVVFACSMAGRLLRRVQPHLAWRLDHFCDRNLEHVTQFSDPVCLVDSRKRNVN